MAKPSSAFMWSAPGARARSTASARRWTDALTLRPQSRAADEFYEPLKRHFTDVEIVQLTMFIGVINTWNRLADGFRTVHPVDRDAQAA